MAASKCASCGETRGFELKADPTVAGTDKKYSFIQCRACGAVVSAVEGWHLSSALWVIMKKLGITDPHAEYARS